MLTHLSIRDIVLIEKLDLNLERRPWSADRRDRCGQVDILLDSLGLALGCAR